MKKVRILRVDEEDELRKKTERLVGKETGNKATAIEVSLLSGNAIVFVDHRPGAGIWFCRDMGDRVIGVQVVAGDNISVISSKLDNDKDNHGFHVCIDLKCITQINCPLVRIKPVPSDMLRATLFKSVESLLEEFCKEGNNE